MYSNVYPADSQGDAGNAIGPFLNGTILNSPREAVVEISNPFYEPMETRNGPLGGKIVLDLNDPMHPRRTSETGEVEEAGGNNEVWVNFGWTGPTEGDFFDPFNTLTAAVNAVAAGGVIKIVRGWTNERPFLWGRNPIRSWHRLAASESAFSNDTRTKSIPCSEHDDLGDHYCAPFGAGIDERRHSSPFSIPKP